MMRFLSLITIPVHVQTRIKHLTHHYATLPPDSSPKTPKKYIQTTKLLKNHNNSISNLLSIYRNLSKGEEPSINTVNRNIFLTETAKIIRISSIPKNNLQQMKACIHENFQQIVKEILTNNDFGDISFITFLNFACIKSLIRQMDSSDNQLVKLLMHEGILSQLILRYDRVTVKSQTYIIKFFTSYKNEIILHLGSEISAKYEELLLRNIKMTLSKLQILQSSSNVEQFVFMWRQLTVISLYKNNELLTIKDSKIILKFLFRNIDDLNGKFLWILMDSTAKWLAANIQSINKTEIGEFWEKQKLLKRLQQLLVDARSAFEQKVKILECLALIVNVDALFRINEIPYNTELEDAQTETIHKAFVEVHKYIDQRLQIGAQTAKIGRIEEFEQNIQEQSMGKIVEVPNFIKSIHINIILQTMMECQYLNHQLYTTINQIFFHLLQSKILNINDIEAYVKLHNQLTNGIFKNLKQEMNKKEIKSQEEGKNTKAIIRTRMMKKQQIQFILKVIEGLKNNGDISIKQFIRILNVLQKGRSIKSRKIKRELVYVKQAWSHLKEGMEEEDKTLMQLMIDNF